MVTRLVALLLLLFSATAAKAQNPFGDSSVKTLFMTTVSVRGWTADVKITSGAAPIAEPLIWAIAVMVENNDTVTYTVTFRNIEGEDNVLAKPIVVSLPPGRRKVYCAMVVMAAEGVSEVETVVEPRVGETRTMRFPVLRPNQFQLPLKFSLCSEQYTR